MYFNPQQEKKSVRDAWVEYLGKSLPASMGVLPEEQREEIINGLAAHIERDLAGKAVEEEFLQQKFVRALNSVRGPAAVAEMLKRDCADGAQVQELDFLDNCSESLREIMAIGWLRQLSTPFRTDGQSWVLRMRPIANHMASGLELALFGEMRRLLGVIVGIWDTSSGEGVLALDGLRFLAQRICGSSNAADRSKLVLELREYCKKFFDKAQRARGWSTTPLIVARDI